MTYGTNFHLKCFVERTYTAFLALEHAMLTMEFNELQWFVLLSTVIQEYTRSSVPKQRYAKFV